MEQIVNRLLHTEYEDSLEILKKLRTKIVGKLKKYKSEELQQIIKIAKFGNYQEEKFKIT